MRTETGMVLIPDEVGQGFRDELGH